MEKTDWIILVLSATCIILSLFILIWAPVEKMPNFDGYRVCLENSKPEYCDTQFKDVHEFLKKNKLKLDK